MLSLTEFLLARIAEDEADAERGGRHNDVGTYANDNYGCLLVDPARVLAECEAKRRIVEREMGSRTRITYRRQLVLRDLAAVYADHPDYREEWKP